MPPSRRAKRREACQPWERREGERRVVPVQGIGQVGSRQPWAARRSLLDLFRPAFRSRFRQLPFRQRRVGHQHLRRNFQTQAEVAARKRLWRHRRHRHPRVHQLVAARPTRQVRQACR